MPTEEGSGAEASELAAGLAPAEAARVYDRIGLGLALGGPFEGRARRLAQDWLAPEGSQRVLEVGVGLGGTLARLSQEAPATRRVGVDVSAKLLARCAQRDPGALLVRGSVTALPCPDASFARAFAAYTLDLLPRATIPLALVELRRVLAPDGRLVVCSLAEGQGALERALMGTWKRIHRLCGPAQVGGCRPLTLAPLLPGAGLRVLRHEHVSQLGTPSEVFLLAPS